MSRSAVIQRSDLVDCPLIRQHESRRRQKLTGFMWALVVHGAVLGIGSFVFVSKAQYAVDQGASSVEVELIEPVPEEEPKPVDTLKVQPQDVVPLKSELAEIPPIETKVIVKPKPVATTKASLQPQNPSRAAQSVVRPDYLSNPAPAYPSSARRQHLQGLVLLSVRVDASGNPKDVRLVKSSGHRILDLAATRAVERWRFKPAQVGVLAHESVVEVPIRFRLDE